MVQVDAGAVICLQELSQQWVGELIPHLEARGYTLVTGLYGRSFNGYMGVGLAWPTSRFMSEAVDISRAADTKPWPPPPPREPFPPNPRSAAGAALAAVKAGVRAGWRAGAACWRRWKEGPPPFDPWAEAERRANILLSARLKCKASGRTFSVSTYHMPCLFGSDPKLQVMTIHAALAARRAADFAGEGVPFVLAGDWNFKPGDAPYELFRNGDLPEGHRHLPPPREGEEWEPNLHHTLVSAYVVCNGQEPHFTNKARAPHRPCGGGEGGMGARGRRVRLSGFPCPEVTRASTSATSEAPAALLSPSPAGIPSAGLHQGRLGAFRRYPRLHLPGPRRRASPVWARRDARTLRKRRVACAWREAAQDSHCSGGHSLLPVGGGAVRPRAHLGRPAARMRAQALGDADGGGCLARGTRRSGGASR